MARRVEEVDPRLRIETGCPLQGYELSDGSHAERVGGGYRRDRAEAEQELPAAHRPARYA